MPNPDLIVWRKATLERVDGDGDDGEGSKTFRAVLATENPVPGLRHRREVLSHDDDAVDLVEANRDGIPIRIEHERLPVARAFDLAVKDRKLHAGRIEMAPSAVKSGLAADVEGGFVREISIGAYVKRRDWRADGDRLVARRWKPVEASFVGMGGDKEALIARKRRESMNTNDRDDLVARSDAIAAIYKGLEGEVWLRRELDAQRSTKSVDEIRADVMEQLKRESDRVERTSAGRVSAGDDALDKFIGAAEATLAYRTGNLTDVERAKFESERHGSEVASMTLREMSREYLRRSNAPLGGTEDQLVERSMIQAPLLVQRAQYGHTSSDFANILAATSDKSLARGYRENSETYQRWTTNRTVPNFRDHNFPVLSTFGDLQEVPETGDYKEGPLSDKKEVGQAKEYARTFSHTRQMILNDDLNALSGIPAAMGRAAARKVGDLVYAVLTGNPTMNETGRQLFNTTDKTLASSGAVISTTTLGAARMEMRTKTAPSPGRGESGATLNTVPGFLIVPAALETSAEVYLASLKDPAEGSTTSFDAVNVLRNLFELIVDARLDASSATAWYVAAARNQAVETVAVLWLNGVQRPVIQSESGFLNGAVKYGVRIDAGAMAGDFRGMYKNPGA